MTDGHTTETDFTFTMPRECKLAKVCARDETRYAIQNANVRRREDGTAIIEATDGRRAVQIPIGVEGDIPDGGYGVPKAALEAAAKGRRNLPDATIRCNGSVDVAVGETLQRFPNVDEHRFPDVDQAAPKATEFRIAFNAKYLAELAAALGSEGAVELCFPKGADGGIDDTSPMVVWSKDGGPASARGLLMPIGRG